MRTEQEIRKLIIDKGQADDRIRAVLLNGSRANKKILPDKFQDFDIVFIVTDIESFTSDHSWVDFFGERIIWQLPDEMTFGLDKEKIPKQKTSFSYLMLFKDGNRIDLTLYSRNKIKTDFRLDSLTIVWLDKEKVFSNIDRPSDFDHLIKKPTEREFLETCNEFWWVSTYVSKGLLRNEITYSKKMLDTVVRPVFMKMIDWFIGTDTDFSVSAGNGGKHIKNFLTESLHDKILSTYSDQQIENNWKSLFTMTEIFEQLSAKVADRLKFQNNTVEAANVKLFLKESHQKT